MRNTIPEVKMKDLLDCGVHYGHRASRWNPLMAEYIYCARGGLHIIDLRKTLPLLQSALETVHRVAASSGRILFVCTKPEARDIVSETAERCGQYFVNIRWLGGILTNWWTISRSIKNMDSLEATVNSEEIYLTKKDRLKMGKRLERRQRNFAGIKKMGHQADLICVIGVKHDSIAVKEANTLKIPVIGVVDTDCSPLGIDHVVPGNDDSRKAIKLYMSLFGDAALSGLAASELHQQTPSKDPLPEGEKALSGESESAKAVDESQAGAVPGDHSVAQSEDSTSAH